MYEEFFHLKNRPFAPVGPVESFVGVGPLGDALRQLQRALAQGQSIALLIGDNGSGKSHLCKYLATTESGTYRPIYLSTAGFHTRRALLQAMLYELGESYVGLTEQEARLKLLEAGRQSYAKKRKLLLILDEAHLLSPKMYEELRTLIDHAPAGGQLIQLVLAGSMELEEQLFAPELQAFNQRVGAQVVLEPLSLQQSVEYIEARLLWASAESLEQVFSEDALETICRACDGNIRCLNQLADHTLLLAYVEEVAPATSAHVLAALKDLKALPLQFNSVGGAFEEPSTSRSPEAAGIDETAENEGGVEGDLAESVPVDERELAELFGLPEELQPADAEAIENSVETEPAEQSPVETVSPAASPNFSVLEVGAEVVDIEPEPAAINEGKGEDAMDVVESTTQRSEVPLQETSQLIRDDSEMQEFGVSDHYAQLDDQFTRADGYLAQLAWENLPQLPAETLGTPSNAAPVGPASAAECADEGQSGYVTGDADVGQSRTAEEQLLATIEELHQELDGMIEHRPALREARGGDAANADWLEYDVVQPGCVQDPAWVPDEPAEQTDCEIVDAGQEAEQEVVSQEFTEPSVKELSSAPLEIPSAPVDEAVKTGEEVREAPGASLGDAEGDARNVYELLFDRLRWRRRQQQLRS